MPKLRVIVGFAAAATAMTAVDNVKADHLRSRDEGRWLADDNDAETTFLDTFASTDAESLRGDVWGADSSDASGFDNLDDDILRSTTQPGTSSSAENDNNTNNTDPTDSASKTADVTTETPAATDVSTVTSTTPSTDASASETPAATEPVGSGTAITATAITATATDATEAPATDSPAVDASATADTAATDAPVTTDAPATAGSSAGQVMNVTPWKQCGGLAFDYSKFFEGGTSANWSTKLNCTEGYSCEVVSPWYYQCQPVTDAGAVEAWGQCGGVIYHGMTKCAIGSDCKFVNDWYSQCVPRENP
ncbi:unnamed protein product [Phytophthora fragariaefolia]|uniref:Unnamed protein product n=1 Tax=Phytophthora fragariaefolia TaxID=1490495 RepID=A0A9W6X3K5_9STRA|nr:unnamed protein product [Phytophthora fragariaefolia]